MISNCRPTLFIKCNYFYYYVSDMFHFLTLFKDCFSLRFTFKYQMIYSVLTMGHSESVVTAERGYWNVLTIILKRLTDENIYDVYPYLDMYKLCHPTRGKY